MRTFIAIAAGAAMLALMPAPPESERANLAAICGETSGVCQTAAHAAETLEAKARFGAQLVIEWASTASGSAAAKLPADLA